jgi:serine/threonine protein kinase
MSPVEDHHGSIGGLSTPGGDGMLVAEQYRVGQRLKCTWTSDHEYVVQSVLSGGFGVVLVCTYDDWDPFAGPREQWCQYSVPRDRIALKLVRIPDERHIDSFADEIRVVNDIAKASGRIVPILAVERLDALGFALVMPYFPKGSLRAAMTWPALDLRERFGIWIQLVLGLREVVERYPNFVHGDIKPENVLLDETAKHGRVLLAHLADFGLSTLAPSTGIAGTPAYMSPEAWQRGTVKGTATDIFSLGVLLFELMTGSLPFLPDASTQRPDYARKRDWSPALSGRPGWVTEITDRCLALDPGERPTLAEIIAHVKPYVGAASRSPGSGEPWLYDPIATREFITEGLVFDVGIKFDPIHADLRRDIPNLLGAGLYDEVLTRLKTKLYESPDSPLFRALRTSDDELFSEKHSVQIDGATTVIVNPAADSIITATSAYATAFLHKLPARMDVTALIPDLLPGLAMGEIYIRGLTHAIRTGNSPESLAGTLGNVHLFYRTAYAALLSLFQTSEVEWVRSRWQVIEAACRAFYASASAAEKLTYDNIFREEGTNGKMIAAVAALPAKVPIARGLVLLLGGPGREQLLRRFQELSFVICHEDRAMKAIQRLRKEESDPSDGATWLKALYWRLLQDAIWAPQRIAAPLTRESVSCRTRFEGVGQVARMEYGADRLWLVKGNPEYCSGDGLDEIDLKNATRRSLGDDLPTRNVLCCHFDGQNLWIGTADGTFHLDLATGALAKLPEPAGPIFEIKAARLGGLWLGGRGVVYSYNGGRVTAVPVTIPEVHRIVETPTLLFCAGDSSGGICILGKGFQCRELPDARFEGYVRDLYAAPGFVGAVGNDHLVLEAETAVRMGGYRVDDLNLSCLIHGDFLAIGDVKGLRLISRALGVVSLPIGTTIALCAAGTTLFAAADDKIHQIDVAS